MKISTYFDWEDVTRSSIADRLGIVNSLPVEYKDRAILLAKNMDAVRLTLGCAIIIDSWYRCLELNRELHSKDTSQHTICEAVDFVSPRYGSPMEVCKAIIGNPLVKFDQLILEYTWVHVSFQTNPTKQRRGQVLTLLKDGTYAPGLKVE